MSDQPVVLINLLKVDPANQAAVITLLTQNTDAVIRNLPGWQTTRLIAAQDGSSVAIYSEWASPADVEAMRNDPRMKAYVPRIMALASLESTLGPTVFSANP